MIISVDFDGTLCEHQFPEIGNEIPEIINYVKRKKEEGASIILWTCREGDYLQKAIEWSKDKGIEFDAVNENVPFMKNKSFAIRKPYADIYLDDRNVCIYGIIAKGKEKL